MLYFHFHSVISPFMGVSPFPFRDAASVVTTELPLFVIFWVLIYTAPGFYLVSSLLCWIFSISNNHKFPSLLSIKAPSHLLPEAPNKFPSIIRKVVNFSKLISFSVFSRLARLDLHSSHRPLCHPLQHPQTLRTSCKCCWNA